MGTEDKSFNTPKTPEPNEKSPEDIVRKARARLDAARVLFEGRVDPELFKEAEQNLETAILHYEEDLKTKHAGPFFTGVFETKVWGIIENLMSKYERPKNLPYD